jgi:hypothetical protein
VTEYTGSAMNDATPDSSGTLTMTFWSRNAHQQRHDGARDQPEGPSGFLHVSILLSREVGELGGSMRALPRIPRHPKV